MKPKPLFAMLAPLLNLLFPPQCLVCLLTVATHGTLCPECWGKVGFIADPYCECCGHPFDYSLGKGALCAGCMQAPPAFAKARSVFRYDDASRALVTKLKYADQIHLSAIYGAWLARFGKELAQESDVIVPVPLHYWRFVGRRYNQSASMAYSMQKHCALPVIPDAVKRTRRTKPQPGLTRRQRKENVRGAFLVPARSAARLKNKRVLLIDDVMTTHATIGECAKALLKAGAAQVNVLTLARKAD